MKLNLLLPLVALLISGHARAESTPLCPTKKGTLCACEISALKPTQGAVGMWEVKRKQAGIAKRKAKGKLDKYLRKKPEPVVLGPGRALYITDHHHLARALQEEGVTSTYCRIDEDLSNLNAPAFWAEMEKRKLVYLKNESGKALPASSLPASVADLRDDPFRSLAGRVREEGGFKKSEAEFSEFAWAEFFRARLKAPKDEKEFLALIPQAIALAKSPEAKGLSGFVGN